MKHVFFQKRYILLLSVVIILLGPILIYWRDAWWPDTIGHFSLSGYLQAVISSTILFSVFALALGAENRIIVDQNGISLKRFHRTLEFISWNELGQVYKENDKFGFAIVFQSFDKSKRIPIYYSTSKHFRIIYDLCRNDQIREMLKELRILH